jgi:hypothetical protein
MTKDEAIRLALTALENAPIEYDFHGKPMDAEFGKQLDAAITALRQALERQTWVHLLPDEKADIRNSVNYNQFMSAGEYATKVQEATEAKLKELNHD